MTTKKQMIANQKNALASTGPVTSEGRAIVATNPIKHGVFSKHLNVASALFRENEGDYQELLENLQSSLVPQNQMESLLVEKIAIDFWRLGRVIRFEAGSIEQHLQSIFKEYYRFDRKATSELIEQIECCKSDIEWIEVYIECLKNKQVEFDQPTWEGDEISSNITEDLYLIARNLPDISYEDREALPCNSFTKLKATIEQYANASKEGISARLIELYTNEAGRLKNKIKDLERNQLENTAIDKLNCMLGSLPSTDNTDKVLKYERSLQKSIFQNLFLLKKLQGVFQ